MQFLRRFFGGRSESGVDAILAKLATFLNSDDAQNAAMPPAVQAAILSGPDVDEVLNAQGEFGKTVTNPIPVNGPIGEVLYLSSLRTATRQPVYAHRLGSIDKVDVFETVSSSGDKWDLLFLTLYHPRKSRLTPRGFSFQEPKGIFAVNEFIDPFPLMLPAAVSAWSTEVLGLPLVGAGMRAAVETGTFLRPFEHTVRLESLELHGRYTSPPNIKSEMLRRFVDKLATTFAAVLRKNIGVDEIDSAELLFFCSAMVSIAYLQYGRGEKDQGLLDGLARSIVIDSLKREADYADRVQQYGNRYRQYGVIIEDLLNKHADHKRAAITVMLHAFECITGRSGQGHMIKITLNSAVVVALLQDCIDFARQRLSRSSAQPGSV
ncbi:MAG: hypothetical protein ACT4N8_12315 [Sphingosinicella sp.]|uniref:hypothetical protein n=1 Tax=Sphingosinicella sp. TaxID=1917971 RepID=UPI00403835A4